MTTGRGSPYNLTDNNAARVTVRTRDNSWTAMLATEPGLPPLEGEAPVGVELVVDDPPDGGVVGGC